MKPRIIVRLKGGMGNQLFCYAAGRRLAERNKAELLIDTVSGFERDLKYKRQYALRPFCISARIATPTERLVPFERFRRAVAKWRSRRKPFDYRIYIEQECRDFDSRLLSLRITGDIYLDGLWQSEKYFKDIEHIVRKEFTIKPPVDSTNSDMATRIRTSQSAVAVHVRWFDSLQAGNRVHNVSKDYYERAVKHARTMLERPHFFLFSDDPDAALQHLSLPDGSYTPVCHNVGDANSYADLWLMSQCRHFITANSSFSWWGAWLSTHKNKMVIVPNPDLLEKKNAWRVGGLIPDEWTRL